MSRNCLKNSRISLIWRCVFKNSALKIPLLSKNVTYVTAANLYKIPVEWKEENETCEHKKLLGHWKTLSTKLTPPWMWMIRVFDGSTVDCSPTMPCLVFALYNRHKIGRMPMWICGTVTLSPFNPLYFELKIWSGSGAIFISLLTLSL